VSAKCRNFFQDFLPPPRVVPGVHGVTEGRRLAVPQRLAFVVQLSPASDGRQGTFVGRISHLVSARSVRFASSEECLAFMASVLQDEEEAS
jgi:hypothetical protein